METATTRNAERAARDMRETIGTCDLCGATDHHLVDGACPGCRPRCRTLMSAGAAQILSNIEAFASDAAAPTVPMRSDEEIEFWGEYFTRHNLRAQGILFEIFLSDPHAIAQAMVLRRIEMQERRHVRAHSRPMFDADLVFLRRQAD